jgi:predicted Mrr-cat superfamily restriction endonuclease
MDAFILRMAPSAGVDRVSLALREGQLIIGWAEAKGLLEPLDWDQFRQIISNTYYSGDPNLRSAGAAAGNMWRFIREMKQNDLVVVPHPSNFYVAEVTGPARYDATKVEEDTAYRRACSWLNDARPIPRDDARAALISRMKVQNTCVRATDLLDEIHDAIENAKAGRRPSFEEDLRKRLIEETLKELIGGRMSPRRFEHLIRTVLLGLGAAEARVIPTKEDKGADIVATFRIAGAFQQVVAVQAKHWKADPPVKPEVVEQLMRGIEAEGADLGMVVTTGEISPEAVSIAKKLADENGIKIELVDGKQFAKLIVEHGIRNIDLKAGLGED